MRRVARGTRWFGLRQVLPRRILFVCVQTFMVRRRCFAVIDENGDIVRMKRVPTLAAVAASVHPAAGVMLLSCGACAPSVIAIPLREPPHTVTLDAGAACLVESAHEELCFGHENVRRKVMTDPRLRTFFWQATGRTLYITRQFHPEETFANDGHVLLCATASLHKVPAAFALGVIKPRPHSGPSQLHSWSNHRQLFAQMEQFRPNFVVVRRPRQKHFARASSCFLMLPCRTLSRLSKKRRGLSSQSSARTAATF